MEKPSILEPNKPALNNNTGKIYIPETFNHFPQVDSSSNESDETVEGDLTQGHTHLTIPSNKFSRAVYLVNLVA